MNKKITLLICMFLFSTAIFAAVDDRLELNTASHRDLILLPGITDSIASAIIEYRNKKGGFSDKEELINIVGDTIYDNIKYDIKVIPPIELKADKINGNFKFGIARDNKYLDGTPFSMSLNFTMGDTFKGYIAQNDYEIKTSSSSKPKEASKFDDEVIHDFTYFIYEYEKADKVEKNVFEPKIFKVVTVEEQKQKFDDIILKLEEKYGTRLSVKEDNNYVTGYYESNPSNDEYFKHPDIKQKLDVKKPSNPMIINDDTEYQAQNYEDFKVDINKKEQVQKEIDDKEVEKRNIYRKLKYKIDSGYISIPYTKTRKYGSGGQGWSVENYFDNMIGTYFYAENTYYDSSLKKVLEDPIYGARLEKQFDKSKIGGMFYKLDNKHYKNSFDHFMLFGEKELDKNSSIYLEYGTVFNKSTTFYVKGFSKYRKMNITTSLYIVSDNTFDYSELDPFGQNYYSTLVSGDEVNPYIKVDYYLPKGNKLTYEYSHSDRISFSSYGLTESYSASNEFQYNYKMSEKLSTQWYASFKRSSKNQSQGSSDGTVYESTVLSWYGSYKMDSDNSLTLKIKRFSSDEKYDDYENSLDIRYYKDFGKNLSTSFQTYTEDYRGTKYRQNKFRFTQKLSNTANLRFTRVDDREVKSSGSVKDYKYSELIYSFKF
ncbi:MAG: helix-hairpin-helix domain-containing protein [Candidatus Absconditabacterales bacterium]|nr:helix-hairpin-helix domain-containing protein [Candidatus Absconditabacterales bacterium]